MSDNHKYMFSVVLDKELNDKLIAYCYKYDIGKSTLIRALLKAFLEKQK